MYFCAANSFVKSFPASFNTIESLGVRIRRARTARRLRPWPSRFTNLERTWVHTVVVLGTTFGDGGLARKRLYHIFVISLYLDFERTWKSKISVQAQNWEVLNRHLVIWNTWLCDSLDFFFLLKSLLLLLSLSKLLEFACFFVFLAELVTKSFNFDKGKHRKLFESKLEEVGVLGFTLGIILHNLKNGLLLSVS